MFSRWFLYFLPALAACSSFETIVIKAPRSTLSSVESLPQGPYLALRATESRNEKRQDSLLQCGLAQVDCGNGFCCHTASTCAQRNGQTVCYPGGISFAPPQSAYRANGDVPSAVTPTPTPTSSAGVGAPSQATLPAGTIASAASPDPVSSEPASDEGARPNASQSGGSSLSGGAIAGIVVGVVIAVLIIVGIIGYFVLRARKRDRIQYDAPATTNGETNGETNGVSYDLKKPAIPAELETTERAEMEGSTLDEKGTPIHAGQPQEVIGTVPVSEKMG